MSTLSNADERETRRIVGNMTEGELREAVKAIPSHILVNEIHERLIYEEERTEALRSIIACQR